MKDNEFLIVLTEIEPPAGCDGNWFYYSVTHKPSGTVAPQGMCRANTEEALKKRLRGQIKAKLADPNLIPPPSIINKEKAQFYIHGSRKDVTHG